MKKTLPIFLWFVFALGGLLSLSAYSAPPVAEASGFSGQNDSKETKVGAEVRSDLYCHLTQTGGTHTLFQALSGAVKHHFNPFFAYSVVLERVYFHTFSQYNFYSEHTLVRLRQTDLIFPFHFFW